MTLRQTLTSGGIGVAVAAVLLFFIRRLTQGFEVRAAFFDTAGLRLTVFWLVLLGAFLGVVVIVSKSNHLVSAVPAVVIGVSYSIVPSLRLLGIGRWLPDAVRDEILLSFGPSSCLVVGVLAAAATRSAWSKSMSRLLGADSEEQREESPVTPRWVLVGSLGGVAIAGVVLFGVGRLTPDLMRAARMGDTTTLRLTVFWLVLLGAFLGVVVIVSESNPLLVGVPAVLLGVAYGALPQLQLLETVSWLPQAISRQVLFSTGSSPYLIVGLLGTLAGWYAWAHYRATRGAEPAR